MREYHPADILEISRGLKEFNSNTPSYAVETEEETVISNNNWLVALPGDQITMKAYGSRYYAALLKRQQNSESRLPASLKHSPDKTWDEIVFHFDGKFVPAIPLRHEGWERDADIGVFTREGSKKRIFYLERNFLLLEKLFNRDDLEMNIYWPANKMAPVHIAAFFSKESGKLIAVFTNSLESQLKEGLKKERPEADSIEAAPKEQFTIKRRPQRRKTQSSYQPAVG